MNIYDIKWKDNLGRREAGKSRCGGGAESWSEEDKYKQDTMIYMHADVIINPTISVRYLK